MKAFSTEVSGKWIMAGEHSVLRGCPALVFPLLSRKFSITFTPGGDSLRLKSSGERGAEFELLLWGVLEKACQKCSISRFDIRGEIEISSSIPIGAGLGASAALCVAIARWFESFGVLKNQSLYEFARELENLFHGESSGVDIAVALSGQPVRFLRHDHNRGQRIEWTPSWQPHLYISYSGKRGVTLECVNKVKAFIEGNPKLGENADLEMREAVELCERALKMTPEEGLRMLVGGLELAQSCFVRWGLVNDMCDKKIKELRAAGAQGVKMTGSGEGGFILSLWNGEPPSHLKSELISCF